VFEGDPEHNYTRDPLIQSNDLVRPVTLAGDPNEIHALVNFETAVWNCSDAPRQIRIGVDCGFATAAPGTS